MCRGITKQFSDHPENTDYLETQILTYLGNKRLLLNAIGEEVEAIKNDLGRSLVTLDLFSGSGIVARCLKQFSSAVYANDLEAYSRIINECYLANECDFDIDEYNHYLTLIQKEIQNDPIKGIISQNYSPADDKNISENDRAFYTNKNAIAIDTIRSCIEKIVPKDYQKYFMARLLIEASIHVNTSGVFKGFYKNSKTGIGQFGGNGENSLNRILGDIDITAPVLSNFTTDYKVFQEDANELVKKLKGIDVAYIDPPYNQHPYGSNYFMLNVITENNLPSKISKVSGIPEKWNRSDYNKKAKALSSLEDLVSNIDSKYLIVSYNNEGFISKQEMEDMLSKYGEVKTRVIEYNTYRGSRNLCNRNLKTNEFLFIVKMEGK